MQTLMCRTFFIAPDYPDIVRRAGVLWIVWPPGKYRRQSL